MTIGRVRILYVCHNLAVGGAEEMILNLMTHLPRGRWEPRVCCIHTEGPIGRELLEAGHPLVALDRVPGWRDPLAVLRLAGEIRRFQPHIVHTFLLTANLYGRLAAFMARVPVVISTEVNVRGGRRWRHRLAERMLARSTNAVVAMAESVKQEYLEEVRMPSSRVEVVYSAVDWDRLRTTMPREAVRKAWAVPEEALVVGTIARLTEQKGLAYLLEAVSRIAPALRNVAVVIVGDGPLRRDLESKTQVLGLEGRVTFLGARRDLGNLLSAMDIFALPSLWEGLPLSLILAMGAGLPVLATGVAGIPEVVQDGRTGLLVRPADADALASAITRLAEDAGLRAQLSRAGQESVLTRFSVARCVDAMTGLYERLLKERAA